MLVQIPCINNLTGYIMLAINWPWHSIPDECSRTYYNTTLKLAACRAAPELHMYVLVQALAFERLLLVVKTRPVTSNLPPRPRIAELRPVNENPVGSYPIRSSDAHQRVPLEPLFHIDTEAQPAAQPMSIHSASDLHSIQSQAQTHVIDGNRPAVDQGSVTEPTPAQNSYFGGAVATEENGVMKPAHASPSKTDNPTKVCQSLTCLRMVLGIVTVKQHTHCCNCSVTVPIASICVSQVARPDSSISVMCCSVSLFNLFAFTLTVLRREPNVFNVQASTILGQSKAGLLNKVHALEAANVPAHGTEVMKVDAS